MNQKPLQHTTSSVERNFYKLLNNSNLVLTVEITLRTALLEHL